MEPFVFAQGPPASFHIDRTKLYDVPTQACNLRVGTSPS